MDGELVIGSVTLSITAVVDLLGVFTAALLGGSVAAHQRFDPVGFIALALISGVGGGMIRDVLLGQGPPWALTHVSYLITALLAALVAFLMDVEHRPWRRRVLLVADSLALAFWGTTGSQRALDAGLGVLPALLLGVITAVGGGAVRDVLTGKTPEIFRGGALYATCAFLAALTVVVMNGLGLGTFGMLAGSALGFTLRLLALKYDWRLPGEAPHIRRR